MARRQLVVLIVLASVLGAACSGGSAEPPTSWSSVSMRATFGPRASLISIAPVGGGFAALGLRSARQAHPRVTRADAPTPPAGIPRIWTSRDGGHWSRVTLHGLPRHVPCGFCGPSQLASRGHVHVLTWWAGDRAAFYRSRDLAHWHRVLGPVRRIQYGSVGVVRGGFLASFREGGQSGPWTYRGLTSRDGRHWTPLPAEPAPLIAGLIPRARLHHRLVSLANGALDREQVMTSTDGRVWTPTGAPAGLVERGPVASADHRRLGAQAYDGGAPDARGYFAVSSDGSQWHEVRSFARRFPHADLARVDRVGRWWLVAGIADATRSQNRQRWTAWATSDLRHWRRWPQPGRAGRDRSFYFEVAHGIAFLVGGPGRLEMFRPRS